MTKELRKAIAPTAICIVLSVLTAYLLGPSGPVLGYLLADLAFLVGPIIAFLVLRLGRKLAFILMPRLGGRLLSHSLSGASFAVLVYVAVSETVRLPGLGISELPSLSQAAAYAVFFVVGLTIHGLANLLEEHAGSRWAKPAAEALSYLLVASAVYAILGLFGEPWPLAPTVGLAFFAGFAACALSALGAYGERTSNRLVNDACRWLGGSRFRMFLLGALLYSYVVLIRPLIAESFPFAPLVEWGVVFLVAWRVYRGIRLTLRDRYSAPLKESPWKKHTQEVAEKADLRLAYLSAIQKEYVELGLKPRLIVNLIAMLNENKWDRDQICLAMIPLIGHEDERVPWYAFLWDQARIQKRNVDRRKKVLDEVLHSVLKQPGALPLQEKTEVQV